MIMEDKEIIHLYLDEKKGVPEISKISGHKNWDIYSILYKNNIPIRSRQEAKSLSSKGKLMYEVFQDKIFCLEHQEYEPKFNFYPSWIQKIEKGMRSSAPCKKAIKNYSINIRFKALQTIAKDHQISIKCQDCEITRVNLLNIAHINSEFGSSAEYREIYTSNISFYVAIVYRERNTSDLGIKCKNHNIIDEFKNGFRNTNSNTYKLQKQALSIIANNNHLKYICQNCGQTDERLLWIEHINGNGRKEIRKLRSMINFYKEIVNGQRNTLDLSILCPNCQKESWDKMRNFK